MAHTLTIPFIKGHGASNDFILLDESHATLIPEPLKAAFARLVSDRQQGIGSDGTVFVSAVSPQQPRMRFFNPDGSEAEMCGNGIRCASRAAFEGSFRQIDPLLFQTLAGNFKTENFFSEAHQLHFVRVTTAPLSTNPSAILSNRSTTPFIRQRFQVEGIELTGTILSVGNPHLLVPVADLKELDLMRLGHALEHHPMFLNRANVSFVQVLDRRTILVQTHERGVGLTLSCGTGMTASVVAQVLNDGVDNQQPIAVHTAGGIVWVTPQVSADGIFAQLTGNATWIYTGRTTVTLEEESIRFADAQRVEIVQTFAEEEENFRRLAGQTLFDRTLLRGTSLESFLQENNEKRGSTGQSSP
ncbi:MAG: diaminopimelate epimerase [Magnetococcales bacterium]|nr:diaminopimelate epimerase [Magnetococcales bacterium]